MPGSEIFHQIDEAATRDDVLDVLAEFYRARGFRSFCFVIPMVTKPDQFRLYERGMPPEWMRRYLERDFDLIDPVSTAATTRNEVGTLGELLKQLTVNDVGRLFVEEATRMGLTDGLAIPTSGLRHARGFFGVDNVAAEDLAKVDRSLMCAVAQHAHLRIDRIEEEHGAGIDGLSPREAEILNWVAAGKSNPEIAMILGISEATVGTHLKRLFTKLGVHDRVSAVLAGFKLGMLR
ncbi:helix-turn-helix transcriptional regulator [Qipengyuania pacifica]|uniref:helix-turn-helix transcriptional regulator n=1 Tax=Qipengyuania pacifica TaxID=2860199 RepID=UPI001C9D82E8|nr:LuxR family transcriptional regulator [Qipengyuania pacifica]MBY8332851.1 LuxR family transcriptional regulator [Qipengyuania pacifica]